MLGQAGLTHRILSLIEKIFIKIQHIFFKQSYSSYFFLSKIPHVLMIFVEVTNSTNFLEVVIWSCTKHILVCILMSTELLMTIIQQCTNSNISHLNLHISSKANVSESWHILEPYTFCVCLCVCVCIGVYMCIFRN